MAIWLLFPMFFLFFIPFWFGVSRCKPQQTRLAWPAVIGLLLLGGFLFTLGLSMERRPATATVEPLSMEQVHYADVPIDVEHGHRLKSRNLRDQRRPIPVEPAAPQTADELLLNLFTSQSAADPAPVEPNPTARQGDQILRPGESGLPGPIDVTVYDYRKKQESAGRLPTWAEQTPLIDRSGGNQVEVQLASQRFATLEEARAQLWQQLNRELIQKLRERYARPIAPLSLAQAEEAGILQEEYRVSWPLEVGDFTETVYQVYWKAQLTPDALRRLFAYARPGIVNDRLLHVAGGFAALTLLMGIGAVALRRRA